ncbi:MAG: HAMP domain-containing histidine kinase [Pirellulaceae bacterium]|jgi:signal transduction histidine kinase|nr:HAMP domain-containing histidine kinase [Pirellulaceae bacterium]
MFERRSLRLPITLGVVLIVTVVLLLVGWVVFAVFGLVTDPERRGWYVAFLAVGATLLALVLVGVVTYLTLTIKAISLSQRQSNFIDAVTHELKSPIASLKLYLQTLNRRQVSAAEQEDFFRFMLDDVERLDSLINHLLDAARIDKDRTPAPPEDVDLAAVLRGVADQVAIRYHVQPEKIKLDLVPCIVSASPVDLELIFRNLIDNAVKYASDEDPQVEVVMRPLPRDRVQIRVCDNGKGIPLQYRNKLFARFIRVGSELERDKPGTGLGLYIVRTLVTRLRGKVRIRDREKGIGTEFEVQLSGRAMPAEANGAQSKTSTAAAPLP